MHFSTDNTMAAAAVPSSNRDFLTPVDTTFKRMYLVSQDVFDEFKRFQDANLPPPADPPPGGYPPPSPQSPSNGANSNQQIQSPPWLGSSTLPQPQISEEPHPHFPCPRKKNNGRPCNSKFDTQEHLDIHIQKVHHFSLHPLSQAAIRKTAERIDQDLHHSIDNERRISATVKAQSHQNIANTTLVQSDNTQCNVCSFKGQSPEDLDNHIRDVHVDHYSISQSMLQPKINHSPKLTPKAISLNEVETYEQDQSQDNDQIMEPPVVEPVAGPSGTSTIPSRRKSRGEPTKILSRGTRGNRFEAMKTQTAPRPYTKRNPHKQASRTRAQDETLAQPLKQTQKSKRRTTDDVQQLEIQPTVEDEKMQKKKNVFDLTVGRKKRKTKHTSQPPSQLWSSIPLPKKKKRKRTKRLIDRYKGRKRRRTKTRANSSIQRRNVAALGLSGY